MGWLVGIDVGGTFTDVVALDLGSSEVRAAKVPSRNHDAVGAIRAALAAVAVEPEGIANLIHGTTRVTNAIVEEKLPPVAFVTTAGFEDTLAIARLKRRELYRLDVAPRRPPLVPAERSFGVRERLDHTGAVLERLDRGSLAEAVESVRASGVSSVAVSLLHAYANPAHERAVGDQLRGTVRHVSLAHEVNPEAREYERASSTVLNAAAMPVAVEYLDELLERLPLQDRFQLFHSAGGWATPEDVRRRPLAMALSGPAAGVTASARLGQAIGRHDLLTFDMGGTTTDVCSIVGGEAQVTDTREIGDRPLRQPMVAVTSIGAGGGSIVRLTPGGLLVGPESAGAEPGPACYGAGGRAPTVTDANLVLGYLSPRRTLGGSIRLDPARAEAALSPVAEALGRGLVETALGVIQVANANMARALRRVTVERGVDGRQATLLAFGGAGPMHAVGLAASFGIAKVVVPALSSGFSAYGCLLSEMAYAQQRTVRMSSLAWDRERFETMVDELRGDLSAPLLRAGVEPGALQVELTGMTRYEGQSDAVPVPFAQPLDLAAHGQAFTAQHRALFGYATEEPWILEGLRVRVSAPSEVELSRMPPPAGRPQPSSVDRCWFEGRRAVETPRYGRSVLGPGARLEGPVVIEDDWSTIVVPPGWASVADAYGNLHIEESGA